MDWFSAHLGTAVEIPALGSVGLSLVGGRLLAMEEGPVAQLLYEDLHGRKLTLGLAIQRIEERPTIRMASLDGLSAGYWQEGELGVAVVSETPQDQLMTIAAAVEAQIP